MAEAAWRMIEPDTMPLLRQKKLHGLILRSVASNTNTSLEFRFAMKTSDSATNATGQGNR
ncbi:hypothetical protein [Paenibacillus thalictri]|uniref:Uncharacterized protein n=1 Tax=Paenibacillus thalictri TaxID=2527873 RepID=A0A4Q9DZB5_9BACL|nr:hypothetical protein [Paenibacillus thalictri]TBL81193.1 hypothetical protein EYB31_03630 [Paenibacillus thalictri]